MENQIEKLLKQTLRKAGISFSLKVLDVDDYITEGVGKIYVNIENYTGDAEGQHYFIFNTMNNVKFIEYIENESYLGSDQSLIKTLAQKIAKIYRSNVNDYQYLLIISFYISNN